MCRLRIQAYSDRLRLLGSRLMLVEQILMAQQEQRQGMHQQ
jgi:hypothetical protein